MTPVSDKRPLTSGAPRPGSDVLYHSTKLYDHNEGLSCCFRQWRAQHSHCQQLHGYALAFRFVFATDRLDENNWCLDFGGLKNVRAWLHEMFDHTVLVATDDPHLHAFETMAGLGLMTLRLMPAVGCEAIARFVFSQVNPMIKTDTDSRVWLESVEVREHSGNSAVYNERRTGGPPNRRDRKGGPSQPV